jgi:hypothetical protein
VQIKLTGNMLYQTFLLEYQIAPASPGRSRVGPALYVLSLLGEINNQFKKHKKDGEKYDRIC